MKSPNVCIYPQNSIPFTHPWTQSVQRGSKENKEKVDRNVEHALIKIMPRAGGVYAQVRNKSKDGSKRPSQTTKTKHRFHASQIDDCAPPEFISLRLMFVCQSSDYAGIPQKFLPNVMSIDLPHYLQVQVCYQLNIKRRKRGVAKKSIKKTTRCQPNQISL